MTASRPRVVDIERRYGRTGRRVLDELRAARAEHGSVEAADVTMVADDTGLPRAHVHGTATFYSDLRPGPDRCTCAGTACFAARGGAPKDAGARPVYCLGACYAGPAALDGGRLVHEEDSAGQIAPIPWRIVAREAVVLSGLTGDAPPAWHVFESVERDAERVLASVEEAGLAGRGGAAFPAAAKWRAAATAGEGPRYLVANGDEGDPGSFADRLLMEDDPDRVLEGMALAALACAATRGIAYVRSEYPRARDALLDAVTRARASGHLGAHFDVEVVEGAGSYVAGEETALIRSVEGIRGGAAARPPYPTQDGLYGRPTVVNNVETLASVPWIVQHGPAAYRKLGVDGAPGTKVVCLNERFARPGAYEVEFGASVRSICEELGGGLRDGHTLRALQVGGPLGGFLAPDALEVPLTVEALRARGVELGHGSLVAFDERVSALEILRHLWQFAADESCGNCAPCRIGSRRGLELAERFLAGEPASEERAVHQRLLDVVGTASLCGFGLGIAPAIRSLMPLLERELDQR